MTSIWIYFISVCVLCAVVRSAKMADVLTAEMECLKEFPTITLHALNSLKKSRESVREYEEKYPDLNCFMKCVGLKTKLFFEDGTINADGMKEIIHEIAYVDEGDAQAMIHEAVEKCVSSTASDDHCQKIGEYIKCKIDELSTFKLKKEFCPYCEHD